MPLALTPKQRAFLRSLANRLKPVVWIGKQGLADEVVTAVSSALTTEELIKVKILESAPVERRQAGAALEAATDAALVQVVGRTLVLYRPKKDKPVIKLPPATPKKG